jgi:hypothetical protein
MAQFCFNKAPPVPMVIPLSTPTWKLSFVRADESSVVEVFEDLAISLELRVVITGLAGFV